MVTALTMSLLGHVKQIQLAKVMMQEVLMSFLVLPILLPLNLKI